MRPVFFPILAFLLLSCKSEQLPQDQYFESQDMVFAYSGRILKSSEGTKLITSASSVKADVYGDTVTVFLKTNDSIHHYVAVELNQEYKGRFRVYKDTLKFALPKVDSATTITIYKETEAANGSLIFNGMRAKKIIKTPEKKLSKIEFIGDSITCGMGADTSEIPCDEGQWFDQHTAYRAYGPLVARALNVNFEVNCVSGMGMYRNWNDENEPVMPEVYPYLHLNGEHGKRARIDKKNAPQIVSIALGTNDFSLGDARKERLPFNKKNFKQNYIDFVTKIFDTYPETKVALLSSPMLGAEEGQDLINILKEIKEEFPDRPVEVFEFGTMDPRGCSYHPSVDDHALMAEKLIPFYRKLLNTP
ncbi:SGNH/GDSL hydrolase family protein [Salinimicrobium sp. HB62]|uniref:SGNH/GDSL hydrolase family protein n=1 Tax=Salinimicrobium sp. HB62 TaxID=3077781 RepID=UPI002D787598|nr:SGNH/GDSL hydrolase family protein [Salinimicrobium sp. HB62]